MFGTIVLFVSLVFLPVFAVARGADPLAASWLISIVGGASVFGCLGMATLERNEHCFSTRARSSQWRQ